MSKNLTDFFPFNNVNIHPKDYYQSGSDTYVGIVTVEFGWERSTSLVTKEVTYSIELLALVCAFFLSSFIGQNVSKIAANNLNI